MAFGADSAGPVAEFETRGDRKNRKHLPAAPNLADLQHLPKMAALIELNSG
ncbi:MAG: hypothetical protein F6J97_07625 [Leptolyngbya sp. SIO4C1]|nr:hypothetical protein [Leptolyngbya sp. SIO4C1]